MVESVILDVCNFLKARHILIPAQNQWLRGSIACFREVNHSCPPNQLKDFVYSQWKLADLKDISAPSLPNNCNTALKLVLPGKYAVQINSAINIGESFYKQLQKVRRPAAEENLSVDAEAEKSSETSSNRTLKLEITDGVVTLLGFEDSLIKKLVEPIVPGVKAILSGPIECRKGVLFLKNENIDILGGEVDTLLIPNATENLLARALNQPENPDPYKTVDANSNVNQEGLLDLSDDDVLAFHQVPDIIENNRNDVPTSNSTNTFNNNSRSIHTISSNSNSTSSRRQFEVGESRITDHSIPMTSSRLNGSEITDVGSTTVLSRQTESNEVGLLNHSVIELDDDDDDFAVMAAETASLAEQSAKTKPSHFSSKQTSLKSFFQENSSKITENCNGINDSGKRRRSPDNIKQSNKSSKIINKQSISENDLRAQLEESYSGFMTTDNDSYTSIFKKDFNVPLKSNNDPKKKEVKSKVLTESKPNELFSFPPKQYPCSRVVRGTVVNIAQKLSITENRWNLSALVQVQGVEMEMDFSTEALDKVFGISASELHAKRKQVKVNPELKEQINELLRSSQRRILSIDCDMKVHFSSYIAKPLIQEIFD